MQLQLTIQAQAAALHIALAASQSDVDEGSPLTVTVTTSNVADATTIPYTITGVSSADLDAGIRASGDVISMVGHGSNFFTKEVTVRGIRVVSAGTVGGQNAVPDAFTEKVAKMIQVLY